MGIKRCPSFSKRPGFPCGLKVLLLDANQTARSQAEELLKECSYSVTTCSTISEAILCLSSSNSSYDVLLADTSGANSQDRQQLLDSSKHLPCILMAQEPTAADILAGIKLGAVDILAKPLSPLKLRNIWQHTVRKMMSNMNINCVTGASKDSEPLASASGSAPAAVKHELVFMDVILEEEEEPTDVADLAAATAARSSTNNRCRAASNAAVALATSSSFYEPTKCLSRTSSSAVDSYSAPDSPASKIAKHTRHGPVHSCPSTRSLTSMDSSYSALQLTIPAGPGSPPMTTTGDGTDGATTYTALTGADGGAPSPLVAAATGGVGSSAQGSAVAASAVDRTGGSPAAGRQVAQRVVKKALRHCSPSTPASKPPLAGSKSGQHKSNSMGPGATAAGPLPTRPSGFTSVPLPTGLGVLPQGMVWGMPMCPLARAPGIVPPATSNISANPHQQHAVGGIPATAGMPAMPAMPWMGMPSMFAMTPAYMPGLGPMGMPLPPLPFTPFGAAPGMVAPMAAAAPGFPSFMGATDFAAVGQMQQQMLAMQQQIGGSQQQIVLPSAQQTGASVAAALNAQLAGVGCTGADGVAAMDDGDAFDFMLGDITAEDDLDVGMSGLLDGELTQLEKDGLKLPSELQELQALEQVQQQAQQQIHQRASFDCSNSYQRQRVSFDCSTASTSTGTRVSFDCSAFSTAALAGRGSQRVSFEVNCCTASKAAGLQDGPVGAAAGTRVAAGGVMAANKLQSAQSCSASLLGSMSDLFADCSAGDSEGMTRVDSCGMLADLHSLFGTEEVGVRDDGCSTGPAELFDDVVEDLPLELAMKKSSSLAELITAGLPPMTVN